MEAAIRQREIMFLLLSSTEPLSLTTLSKRYPLLISLIKYKSFIETLKQHQLKTLVPQ